MRQRATSRLFLTHGATLPLATPGTPLAPTRGPDGAGGVMICYQGLGDEGGGIAHLDPDTGHVRELARHRPCQRQDGEALETRGADGEQGKRAGCQFNSPNDVCRSCDGKGLFFTDPSYGYVQGFRDHAAETRVYYLDLATLEVSIAAEGFRQPNGVCASPCGRFIYATDTAYEVGDGTQCQACPRAIYQLDVAGPRGALSNRKLIANVNEGIPDGIKCDTDGLLFVGCGDGVRVYDPFADKEDCHLGTLLVDGGVSNLTFCRNVLVANNQTRMLAVELQTTGAERNDDGNNTL